MYKGKIEAIYSIQGFIRRSPEEYVLLSNSNIAMNIDFDEVMAAHLAAKADAEHPLLKREKLRIIG